MKVLTKIGVGCFLIGMSMTSVQAQEITTKAVLDSTHIMLGDQINLRLEVKQPADAIVAFPTPSDTLTPNVEIVRRSKIDTVKLDNNQLHIYQNFVVTSFDSGQHQIPPFYFKLDFKNVKDSLKSNALTLNVGSFDVDLQKGITDIKPPHEAPLTLKEVSPYILGVIILGGIIFLIFYTIRRRKRGQSLVGPPPKPLEPAHIIALRELERVKSEALWKDDKEKQYYSDMTDILRNYIEYRFEVPAMESTTDEILRDLTANKGLITEKAKEQLTQVLQLADLVKFAKYKPLPDDNQISLANSFFFVNQTKMEEKKRPEKPVDDREGEEVELK
ncbi:hypothetical protein EMN47_12770 [Prolixibacteraceae bacterium JC049]|nr:hypothetical protein [Prolixibacteraceae bacterium JC049]